MTLKDLPKAVGLTRHRWSGFEAGGVLALMGEGLKTRSDGLCYSDSAPFSLRKANHEQKDARPLDNICLVGRQHFTWLKNLENTHTLPPHDSKTLADLPHYIVTRVSLSTLGAMLTPGQFKNPMEVCSYEDTRIPYRVL